MLILLFMILVGLGIGYALIQTNLSITGISIYKNQTWNVHFEDLTLNPGNVNLSSKDVAAVNSGTLDAMIGVVTNNMNDNPIGAGNQVPNYAKYTATYSDGVSIAPNHILRAGYSETFKVRLEYRTDITANDLPGEPRTLTFNFGVQYVKKDSNAIERPLPIPIVQLPEGRTKDNLQVGDEITINGETTEYFNFIRYDRDDIILLAKYNLKVGEM